MRTGARCAKVRPGYASLLEEACASRPHGYLLVSTRRDLTTDIVAWASGRVGLPKLSPDRLRATYICRSLEEGASFFDLAAWTGVSRAESLVKYFEHVKLAPRRCPAEDDEQGGAK